MKLYTKAGKLYKGSYHKMKDGSYHTGKSHTAKSKKLFKKKMK